MNQASNIIEDELVEEPQPSAKEVERGLKLISKRISKAGFDQNERILKGYFVESVFKRLNLHKFL